MQQNTVFIPLSGKAGAGKFMMADEADAPLFAGKLVGIEVNGYANVTMDGKRVKTHRVIMQPPSGMDVDHINGNKLDNRRANLRVCTRSQNRRNAGRHSGEFKGVRRRASSGLWAAGITVDMKFTHLGTFEAAQEAADVYDAAAYHYHGEFAHFNTPGPVTPQAAAYLAEYFGPRWEVISPLGEATLLDSLRPFCIDRGLNFLSMLRVSTGHLKEYEGWKCKRISNLGSRTGRAIETTP